MAEHHHAAIQNQAIRAETQRIREIAVQVEALSGGVCECRERTLANGKKTGRGRSPTLRG